MAQRRNHKGIYKIFKLNENKNTMYHKLWDVAMTIFRGNFIVIYVYIRKKEF